MELKTQTSKHYCKVTFKVTGGAIMFFCNGQNTKSSMKQNIWCNDGLTWTLNMTGEELCGCHNGIVVEILYEGCLNLDINALSCCCFCLMPRITQIL